MTSLWAALWAAPAAVGFAIVFRVWPRALPFVAAVAVLAKILSVTSVWFGLTLVGADFVAGLAVGSLAAVLAPRLGESPVVLSFAPVIPLVPGSVIAKSLVTSWSTWITSTADEATAHNEDFVVAAGSGLFAGAVVLALCLGVISPILLRPRPLSGGS